MSNPAKLIAFSAIKGGVGKTTIAFNTGSFIASQGKKTLIIDLDFQGNMSSNFRFDEDKLQKSDIAQVFLDNLHGTEQDTDIEPQQIDEDGNLFGLTTSNGLENLDDLFSGINNGWSVVTRYLINKVHADKEFDYIIFDTHPNLGLATKNAVINSDIMIIPVEPGRYSTESIKTMNQDYKKMQHDFTDPLGNPYLNADMLYVGNMLDFTTIQTKKFLNEMENNDKFIGYFHRRQVFKKAEAEKLPVLNYLAKDYDKNLYEEISSALNNVYEKLEKHDE